MSKSEASREAFEKWWASIRLAVYVRAGISLPEAVAEAAWQASRSQALEEAAQVAIAAGDAAAETYGDGAECIRTAEFAAEAIRALKEQK